MISIDDKTVEDAVVRAKRKENGHYVHEHYDDLREKYGGQLIAVLEQGVIDTHPVMEEKDSWEDYQKSVETFLDTLREEYGERFDEIYTELISTPEGSRTHSPDAQQDEPDEYDA